MNYKVSAAIAEIMRTDILATPAIEYQSACQKIRDAVMNAVFDFREQIDRRRTARTCPDFIDYIFTLSGISRASKDEIVEINPYSSSFSDYNQLADIIQSVAPEYPDLYFKWPYVESPSGISDEELGARIAGEVSIGNIPERLDFTTSCYQFGLRLYTGVMANKRLTSMLQNWLTPEFYDEFPDLKPEET